MSDFDDEETRDRQIVDVPLPGQWRTDVPPQRGRYLITRPSVLDPLWNRVEISFWDGAAWDHRRAPIAWMPLPEPYKP